MEIHFCFRHPDSLARTRCYYCKKDICSVCVVHAAHHYFCGRKCYFLYSLQIGKSWAFSHKWYLIGLWNFLLLGILLIFFFNRQGYQEEFRIFDTAFEESASGELPEGAVYFPRLDSVLNALSNVSAANSSEPDASFTLKSLPARAR